MQIDPQPGGNRTVTTSGERYERICRHIFGATMTGASEVAYNPVTLHVIDDNTAIRIFQHFIMRAAYNVTINATDNSSATCVNASAFMYRHAIALRMDADLINFGSLNPGGNVSGDLNFATTDKPTIQNIGNVVMCR